MELRKKEFKFKGKTLEELKTLDIREFAKYLNSRQRRTVLRQFQKIEGFVNRAKEKIETDLVISLDFFLIREIFKQVP